MRGISVKTIALAAGISLAFAGAPAGVAAETELPDELASKITADGVNRHLIAFQRIADTHDGNRATGQPGYDASVDYVAGKLRAAGYEVSIPEFAYKAFYVDHESLHVAGKPTETLAMEYSPATPQGGLTAPLAVVPPDDTPGCEPGDYDGVDVNGKVALIQRGVCTYTEKQRIAAEHGAVAAIVFNNVDGELNGTLGDAEAGMIPTAGVSKRVGEQLSTQNGAETVLDLQTRIEDAVGRNVIAQTRTGRTDNVVMSGAHLDSVPEGAGINDNGTGSAGQLEAALRLGGAPNVNNAVRFAWWGAEESGLIGSTKYVRSLSFEEQLDIALYTNYDMIGSPNAGYFAYDGDDSDGVGAGPGPVGSGAVEKSLVDYLAANDVSTEGTDFDGRSDYGEFIAAGIPSGGLFTGAEQIKTPTQAKKWGGEAGVAYDPNYHQPGDNLFNVHRAALERNSKALAYVNAKYALSTEDVNGVPPREQRAELRGQHQQVTAAQPARGNLGHHSLR